GGHGAALVLKLNDLLVRQGSTVGRGSEAEADGGRWGHEGGIVPGQFREGVGQVFQPAGGCGGGVGYGRGGAKSGLQLLGCVQACAGGACPGGPQRDGARRQGRVPHQAVVQCAPPPGFKIACEGGQQALGLPVGANRLVPRAGGVEQTAPVGPHHLIG